MLKELGHATLRSFLGYSVIFIVLAIFFIAAWSTINILGSSDATEIEKFRATEDLIKYFGIVVLVLFAFTGLITIANKLGDIFLSQIRPQKNNTGG